MTFEPFIRALGANQVECTIIGGAALAAQGSSYVTRDFDIAYARDRENIKRLVLSLRQFEPRLRVEGEPDGVAFVFDERTISNGCNFTLQTKIGDIDILGEVVGFANYEELLAQSEQLEIYGQPIRVLSLRGILHSKEALCDHPERGLKDRLVLPELRAMIELQEAAKSTEENL